MSKQEITVKAKVDYNLQGSQALLSLVINGVPFEMELYRGDDYKSFSYINEFEEPKQNLSNGVKAEIKRLEDKIDNVTNNFIMNLTEYIAEHQVAFVERNTQK